MKTATQTITQHNALKYSFYHLHRQTGGSVFRHMIRLRSISGISRKTQSKLARYVFSYWWTLSKAVGLFLTNKGFKRCPQKNRNRLSKAKIFCRWWYQNSSIKTLLQTQNDLLFFLYRQNIWQQKNLHPSFYRFIWLHPRLTKKY